MSTGSVWTTEEFCAAFKVDEAALHLWIEKGLAVLTCPDGSLRITHSAVTDFLQRQSIISPYYTADEAASYLKTTKKAVYNLVERRKLRKLPGSRRLRFTKEDLDSYIRGGNDGSS